MNGTRTDVIRKFKVIPLAGDSHGHIFNVQEWNSYDGGESFWYAGFGRFCKTMMEADAYITERTGWNQ